MNKKAENENPKRRQKKAFRWSPSPDKFDDKLYVEYLRNKAAAWARSRRNQGVGEGLEYDTWLRMDFLLRKEVDDRFDSWDEFF